MINNILIVLYNLLDSIKINLVGQMKMNEIIVLLLIPFVYKFYEFHRYPMLRKIIITYLVILFWQIVTDFFIVGSASSDYLRGWSQIVIALVSVVFLFKILNGYQAIALYIAIGVIRNIISDPIGVEINDAQMQFYKFKVFPIIGQAIYALSIYLYYKGKPKTVPVIFILFALVCLAMDSRSRGLVFILSAILYYAFYNRIKLNKLRIIVGIILFVTVFQGMYIFYVNATLDGKIGGDHAQAQLARLENPYNPFKLLETGRGETFAAIEAIKDAPWFGHGSWAKDKTLKYYKIILEYHDEEFNELKAANEQQLIPSHSILLGAWVNYGLGAFLTVVFLFYLILKMSARLITKGQAMPIYPIFIPMTIELIWTFMFSPFQQLRYGTPDNIAIFLTSYYLLQSQLEKTNSEKIKEDLIPAFKQEQIAIGETEI